MLHTLLNSERTERIAMELNTMELGLRLYEQKTAVDINLGFF